MRSTTRADNHNLLCSLHLAAKRTYDTLQALLSLIGDGIEDLVADDAEHGLWIGDVYTTRCALCAHNHVAREQQADIRLLLKRAVRQGRVAGTQDDVGFHLDTELLAHGLA